METEVRKGYYSNGNPSYEQSYINSIRHGLQKWWFDNGQLGYEYFMKYGQFHGISQGWHSDGRRGYIQQWKNDQNGLEIIFNYGN
jgi:antitoxin component YwqK of YwqJK toxin-antitoxin module